MELMSCERWLYTNVKIPLSHSRRLRVAKRNLTRLSSTVVMRNM